VAPEKTLIKNVKMIDFSNVHFSIGLISAYLQFISESSSERIILKN